MKSSRRLRYGFHLVASAELAGHRQVVGILDLLDQLLFLIEISRKSRKRGHSQSCPGCTASTFASCPHFAHARATCEGALWQRDLFVI